MSLVYCTYTCTVGVYRARSLEFDMTAAGLGLVSAFRRHLDTLGRSVESCTFEDLCSLECRAEALLRNIHRAERMLGRESGALISSCRRIIYSDTTIYRVYERNSAEVVNMCPSYEATNSKSGLQNI